MKINYTADAFNSLVQLVNYIEEMNTAGAGIRWLDKYETFLQQSLSHIKQIRSCHNLTFNQLGLQCIYFNDWIIAFSVHTDFVLVEVLLHKSRISD